MKKTLVILGHPSSESFSACLADKYCEGAKDSGNEIKRINVGELDFAPFLKNGYSKEQYIEPDILKSQEQIKWANHLVFIYPTWWATPTALLKAFIERTMLPGFAYKFKKSKHVVAWDKLLKGKSARIISTMDTPPIIYKWIVGDPGYKMMKDMFHFCGIKPVSKTYFGSVKMSSEATRRKWLSKCLNIGRND
ncbi:MAG: NAD(P)H-dependent oxidoreductase [candidate division Zixibacteria bacterium]|nr:NAD(P)H-dependent oxidoreductase [candidate division Zixibacteria bacterium]